MSFVRSVYAVCAVYDVCVVYAVYASSLSSSPCYYLSVNIYIFLSKVNIFSPYYGTHRGCLDIYTFHVISHLQMNNLIF